MEAFTREDELFIQKFSGLQTEESQGALVTLPDQAVSTTNWACTFIAKIITDRSVIDGPFIKMMQRAWNTDPSTVFRPLGKNAYLIELPNVKEMEYVFLRGPWMYRGDLVAIKKVIQEEGADPELVTHEELWVQFHDPPNNLTRQGLHLMAAAVGPPVTVPSEVYVAGRRFVKAKVSVNIAEPLKDRV